jgi:Domain of unknown function (DUF4190)/Double zinc ribbon
MNERRYPCPQCGEMNAKTRLCRACGASMDPAGAGTDETSTGGPGRCAECGAERSPGDKYCRRCGAPAQATTACPTCGVALTEGQVFCHECGTRVKVGAAPATAAATDAGMSGSVSVQLGPTNGFAVASIALALIGGSILAIIFGHVALNQIERSGGRQEGRGLATAGLVLGWIEVVVAIIVFVGFLATKAPAGF